MAVSGYAQVRSCCISPAKDRPRSISPSASGWLWPTSRPMRMKPPSAVLGTSIPALTRGAGPNQVALVLPEDQMPVLADGQVSCFNADGAHDAFPSICWLSPRVVRKTSASSHRLPTVAPRKAAVQRPLSPTVTGCHLCSTTWRRRRPPPRHRASDAAQTSSGHLLSPDLVRRRAEVGGAAVLCAPSQCEPVAWLAWCAVDRSVADEESDRDAEHPERQVDEVVKHGLVLVREQPEQVGHDETEHADQ